MVEATGKRGAGPPSPMWLRGAFKERALTASCMVWMLHCADYRCVATAVLNNTHLCQIKI